MLITKPGASENAWKLWLSRLTDHDTSGGSSETDENEFAVIATSFDPLLAVTTVTPVAN